MKQDVVVIVAEDDEGHFALIRKNLQRSGVSENILRFADGQEVLDFLNKKSDGPKRQPNRSYLLLLDIRMPKVDGIEVLREVKSDPDLKKIPVIMLTTTDDPVEVNRCHDMGCSIYIVKPVEYDIFIDAIRKIGMFLSIVNLPVIERLEV